MKLWLILAFYISLPAYSIEYIQGFKKVPYNSNFDLDTALKNNNCTKLDLQKKIFDKNNRITVKTKFVKVQTCYQDNTFTDEELYIKNWDILEIPKGFILSKAIEKNNCKNIYTKQIPHFYLKNQKKPKDVNYIQVGQSIFLQNCQEIINDNPIEEDINTEVETNIKKQSTYKLYGYVKNEVKITSYGLGYKNDWMDSSILIATKKVNLEINPSILKTSIFVLQGYLGYQNQQNDTNLYANLGLDVNLGRLTAKSIFDYKKHGSFLGLSYQINNPINIQSFYYQKQIGFGIKYFFDY